jgi:hypothetical protein
MCVQPFPEIGGVGWANKYLPTGDQLQQRAHGQERIVLSSKVCLRKQRG